jgi:hypothetical protein
LPHVFLNASHFILKALDRNIGAKLGLGKNLPNFNSDYGE